MLEATNNQNIDVELRLAARQVGAPMHSRRLSELQLEYWGLIQQTMNAEGYEKVRSIFPGITPAVATALENASLGKLARLASVSFCWLKPTAEQQTIVALLQDDATIDDSALLVLQSLSTKEG